MLILFVGFTLFNKLDAQQLFYCDSITDHINKYYTGNCPYFYNFTETTIDSFESFVYNYATTDKDSAITTQNKNIYLIAPFNKAGIIEGIVSAKIDGKLFYEISFLNGLPNGYFYHFAQGDTISRVRFINGKKEGEEKIILGTDSYVVKSYKNGLLDGSARFYRNNQLEAVSNYKNGKKQGVEYTMYSTGELGTFLIYKDHKVLDGVYFSFSPEGVIENEFHYKNGSLEKTIVYDDSGNVFKIIEN